MSDTQPDRIWVDASPHPDNEWHTEATPKWPEVEYVRVDLHDAALAERDARIAELERIINGCQWYWPADDTGEDTCALSWQDVLDFGDLGEIWEVKRGGIVETMWCAILSPAPDADSDDNFEVCEASRGAAWAKIDAELARRAALSTPAAEEEAP